MPRLVDKLLANSKIAVLEKILISFLYFRLIIKIITIPIIIKIIQRKNLNMMKQTKRKRRNPGLKGTSQIKLMIKRLIPLEPRESWKKENVTLSLAKVNAMRGKITRPNTCHLVHFTCLLPSYFFNMNSFIFANNSMYAHHHIASSIPADINTNTRIARLGIGA